jgi:hypothetical protein
MGVKRDTLVRMLADPLISQEVDVVLFTPNAPPTCMSGSAVIVAREVYLSKIKCLGIKRNPHGAFLKHLDFIDQNDQPIYEL